jgi:hypothetical protein
VFVEVKPNPHRSGSFVETILLKAGFNQRGVIRTVLFRDCVFVPHLQLDLLDVIEVVGESDVDVRESERRELSDYLVGAHSLMFVPCDDV